MLRHVPTLSLRRPHHLQPDARQNKTTSQKHSGPNCKANQPQQLASAAIVVLHAARRGNDSHGRSNASDERNKHQDPPDDGHPRHIKFIDRPARRTGCRLAFFPGFLLCSTAGSPSYGSRFRFRGIVVPLVAVVSNKSEERAQANAAAALCSLSSIMVCRARIIEAGALLALSSAVAIPDPTPGRSRRPRPGGPPPPRNPKTRVSPKRTHQSPPLNIPHPTRLTSLPPPVHRCTDARAGR